MRHCRASIEAALSERVCMHIRGSSLIESLAAMSIFSIGSAASGAWFMQATLADARASRLLAANAIAASLEARMRSNPVAVAEGAYAVSSDAVACAHFCDAQALAADDLRRLREALAKRLGPTAHGSVRCESADSCVIRITWHGAEILTWAVEL